MIQETSNVWGNGVFKQREESKASRPAVTPDVPGWARTPDMPPTHNQIPGIYFLGIWAIHTGCLHSLT